MEFEKVRSCLDERSIKKYGIDVFERAVKICLSLSGKCEVCTELTSKVVEVLDALCNGSDKDFKLLSSKIFSHLEKEHKYVKENYYTGIYMSLGISLGMLFGVTLDNIAIGLPLGLAVGLAIGAGKDSQIKKEGRVI